MPDIVSAGLMTLAFILFIAGATMDRLMPMCFGLVCAVLSALVAMWYARHLDRK